MEPQVDANRQVWESASEKHVREYDDLLAEARAGGSLVASELRLLAPILAAAPEVVHLQSGQGLDDVDLVRHGARSVVGVDYSLVATGAAQRRADELGLPIRYVNAEVPARVLDDACADLVYTGKGALIWMVDLDAWARDIVRLLRPGGHLFVHEAHPLVPVWSWDTDEARVRPDRGYFASSHVNDSFPAGGAVEWQRTLGQIVTTVVSAGLEVLGLEEYPDPFWRPGDLVAAAWNGQLPNSFALLARRT